MQVHFFSIPAIGGQSAQEQLNQFLGQQRILGLQKEFVANGEQSFWSLCITIDKAAKVESQSVSKKRSAVDYRDILSPEDFACFARLRDLRKVMSEQQGVPVYGIFTNQQLAEMATMSAPSLSAISQIDGIGEKRRDQYGQQFLDVIIEAQHMASSTPGL